MNSPTAADFLQNAGLDPGALRVMLPSVDPASVPIRSAPAWFRALWVKGIHAVAMPWAIYLEPDTFCRCRDHGDRATGTLVTHELTHIEQWRRGGVRHTIQYIGDYLRGRRRGLGHWDAYRDIRSEAEAREVAGRFVGEHI
jgi:hypothetical protein